MGTWLCISARQSHYDLIASPINPRHSPEAYWFLPVSINVQARGDLQVTFHVSRCKGELLLVLQMLQKQEP